MSAKNEIIKTLNYVERSVWGTCPVCGAGHGTPCDYCFGGQPERVFDQPTEGGVHLGRIMAAPKQVRITPIQ